MKNSLFFKTCTAVVLATSLMTSFNANALVGLAFKNKVSAVTGGVITAIGGSGVGLAALAQVSGGLGDAIATGFLFGIPGAALAVVGIVVLGDGDNAKLQYTAIPESEKSALGLTDGEFNSYNRDFPIINAMQNQILSDSLSDDSFNEQKASAKWTEYLDAAGISKDTRSAVMKITVKAAQKTQAAKK